MHEYWLLIVGAVFVNNIILARYLGNCPFFGVSNRMDTATGMAMAVVFVITLASCITWLVEKYVLAPFGLEYLETIAFILVIASLVQLVEMFLQKSVPALYRALGIYLPLITTNCAVLGVAVLCVEEDFNFIKTLVFAFASAVGYGMALIMLTGIRERILVAPVPKHLQGLPVGLISGGLLALAFLGFLGMV
ncbi:electron transport complex protein RnfA [Desulfacinum hydrothermale DSM 13146]|uniref:Ion-translocating oxidoreductase complex subunit A n=1 Tax=Desulfacinum hydrothermale DSM 13146 TaxID=1121390 RepID=A0A1W1XU08_9BACT|nr:electron transport complex subunit RsxA [Desulfacinum hydrothermale]SMC27344.1 electron transport complex protein RnfA [Desulfacinum hydrothermale DSM 13146]